MGGLIQAAAANVNLRMQLNPTLGTVSFSHNLAQLFGETVEVYADYTSGTMRVTDSPYGDADPTVIIDEWGRRMLVWHRSPNEETSQLWYKVIAYAVQVNRPPVSGVNAVQEYFEDATGTPGVQALKGQPPPGWALRPPDIDPNGNPTDSGIIFLDPIDEGKKVQIQYLDATGTAYQEVHEYPGLVNAPEYPVPINTVAHETQVALAPEKFWLEYAPNQYVKCIRYWLFWTSTRDLFDANPNVATLPYRSGDLYYQALNPTFPTGAPR
jgi:hypothetical protein